MIRTALNLIVELSQFVGLLRNWIAFKIWRVRYKQFPRIRGKIFLRNFGSIEFLGSSQINSNLNSSQLGYYPKTILHTSRTGKIIVGENVGISNVCLNSRNSIKLNQNVKLGAGVKIYDNDFHDLYHLSIGETWETIPSKPVLIDDNAFIVAGSIVLKGVHVGKNSIVGAGSVVSHDIPDNEVWAGNPARFIKKVGIPGAHSS